ncbi:hypothetical protein I307_06508 [Cryptococcus deuterogattii 99/473]|uniref:Unplaced genomic scaffold supercont1.17, whole genome shotgun sequence n=1 Tax=Cryptococcus deuterogattii Ram5 TaxID=1296110 RepID=A0A0D0UVL4_9TREE|nr:hypothetical protein I309_06446 [Cryptococcus deuterogattii LA55]KIR38124.1 hypothetical protein I313_06120 [Cryptococcus deuterogattii Ram5]KIR94343.1 hypothetical protein I304_01984 [Cryptococcus deuterogattii CBS 10090]KIY54159.1 hypothetical protein I307_06508 [Cryptococcus deuterogattii 99/473]
MPTVRCTMGNNQGLKKKQQQAERAETAEKAIVSKKDRANGATWGNIRTSLGHCRSLFCLLNGEPKFFPENPNAVPCTRTEKNSGSERHRERRKKGGGKAEVGGGESRIGVAKSSIIMSSAVNLLVNQWRRPWLFQRYEIKTRSNRC